MAVGGSTLESWIDRKTLEHDDVLVLGNRGLGPALGLLIGALVL